MKQHHQMQYRINMLVKVAILCLLAAVQCAALTGEIDWAQHQQQGNGKIYRLGQQAQTDDQGETSEPPPASTTTEEPSTTKKTPPQGAAGNQNEKPKKPANKINAKSVDSFRKSLRMFSAVMYNRIAKNSKPDENIFFSPASISHALGMLNTGAKGETSAQIKESLQMSADMPNSDIDAIFKLVTAGKFSPDEDSDIKVIMAARSYLQREFAILEQYKQNLQEFYHSDAQRLNFINAVEAAKTINTWVEKQTNDLIKDLVQAEQFTALTKFVLVNALYFKAPWAEKFSDSRAPMDFYTPTGMVQVPFLHRQAMFKRMSTKKFEYIGVPYEGEKMYYFIVMPKTDKAMKEFEKEKNLKTFLKMLKFRVKSWETEKIRLFMPEFTTEMSLDVKKILPSMGVTDVFSSSKADLSGISKTFLHVTEFLHKAKITVNKDGTEAAAATAVMGALRSLGNVVRINRPFIFGVFEMKGDILFMGKMVNPSRK